jgi:patatin-like phospholipase domain-containing protein 2
MTSDLLAAAKDIRKLWFGAFNPKFSVCKRLNDSLMALLPDNIHETANKQLHISVTGVYNGENFIIQNYANKQELVDVRLTIYVNQQYEGSLIVLSYYPVFNPIWQLLYSI